ncbi:MAG: hypothetical protein IH881_13500, partial [Myxococcales bacterium]|nr:hypothetical protein [Myxococcales bacterium]
MSVDLRSLIGRLSPTTRRALEGAAGLAMSLTHYDVELEHWLEKMLEESAGDLPKILRDSDVEPDRFMADLNLALNSMKTGNGRRPDLSEIIEQLASEAWVLCSINYNLGKVRSGAILLAALNDSRLRRRLVDIHRPVEKINVEALSKDFLSIVEGSAEDREVGVVGSGSVQRDLSQPGATGAGRKTPALDQYTVDVTAQARAGEIDPTHLGSSRDVRLSRRITEKHFGTDTLEGFDELIDTRVRHLERGKQPSAKQPIPKLANAILCTELDRRAPDDDF